MVGGASTELERQAVTLSGWRGALVTTCSTHFCTTEPWRPAVLLPLPRPFESQVPDEVPPCRDKEGRDDWWPPGWGPGRRVESEADIFELLGLPPRSPPQRSM